MLACARLQRLAKHRLELLIHRRAIKRRHIVWIQVQLALLMFDVEILSNTDGFLAHPHAK